MAKSQTLIVTQRYDPHADDVIRRLYDMGDQPIRLNTDDIPERTRIALNLNRVIGGDAWQGGITIDTNDRVIDVTAVRSIWWRRPGDFVLPEALPVREREFAKLELEHTLMSLWASLDCYWISHPRHIRHAGWKGGQLQRAAQVGFDVPKTIITNDPAEALAFFESCRGQMVFKVMSDPFLGAREVVAKYPDQPIEACAASTVLMTEADLAKLETIRLVPCLFQEYIPKQVELRVTVIGDEVFAAEIDSQSHDSSRIDWRNVPIEEIPMRPAELPPEIIERCLAFVRSYQLNFSAMDLIRTPDGRYVFLESNPNGQFIFVEMMLPQLKMIDALATCLIRGANS